MAFSKQARRNKVRRRIRKHVFGTAQRPRLSVFRSNKEIYVQVIDDVNGKTLVAASSQGVKEAHGVSKTDQAKVVGSQIAERAKAEGIESVVFDRNGYLYHGRVKALTDAAREGGLQF